MGPRGPGTLNLRRPSFSCPQCRQKFLSIKAFRLHRSNAHKEKGDDIKSPKIALLKKSKPKLVLKRKISPPTSKVNKAQKTTSKFKSAAKMPVETRRDTKSRSIADEYSEEEKKSTKIEAECPVCKKGFISYFATFKHIQKCHPVNDKGEKVPTNSPHLIKPIRVEFCEMCSQTYPSSESHKCPQDAENSNRMYVCAGCDHVFFTNYLFDSHVVRMHGNDIESMFFPTIGEFLDWKMWLEDETKVKYMESGSLQKHKTAYRCTVPVEGNKKSLYCPSLFTAQEFTTGFQIHYFKQHHGHSHNPYKLLDKFKKYSITTLLKKTNSHNELLSNQFDPNVSEENDLYLQFKTTMECIIVDAAKINITTLKYLLGKAFEMTSILTNYDEDDDENKILSSNKTLTDEQITKALETVKSTQNKRKSVGFTNTNVKKLKKDEGFMNQKPTLGVKPSLKESNVLPTANKSKKASSAKVEENDVLPAVNEGKTASTPGSRTPSLKENDELPVTNITDTSEENEINKEQTVVSPIVQSKSLVQSPSFNDSYKIFVSAALKGPTFDKGKKKNIVKTKMGQFKPHTSPNSMKKESPSKKETPDATKKEAPNASKKELSDALQAEIPIASKKELLDASRKETPEILEDETSDVKNSSPDVSKTEMPDISTKFVPTILKKPTPNIVMDDTLDIAKKRTPNIRRRKEALKTLPPTPPRKYSIGKIEDIEYVVKEQENDCNILILKI